MSSQEMQDFAAAMRLQREESAGEEPTTAEARAAFAETLGALPPLGGASIEPADAGGVQAEWVRPEAIAEFAGTLLYLHGGAYRIGAPSTHRRLVTALAAAAGVRALSVDYRLAPEHPFPAAVDDAVTAYRWLVGQAGESPSRVIVAGDSAGGGLSTALLVSLRDAGARLPAGGYLISPWTDLAGTGASIRTRADVEPMLDPDGLLAAARLYHPDGDLTDPLVSPLYADLAGLPPLLVHAGDAEILLDDTTRLVERARAAGVEVDSEIWPGAFHVFQLLAGLVPEADEAVGRAGAWMAARLGKSSV